MSPLERWDRASRRVDRIVAHFRGEGRRPPRPRPPDAAPRAGVPDLDAARGAPHGGALSQTPPAHRAGGNFGGPRTEVVDRGEDDARSFREVEVVDEPKESRAAKALTQDAFRRPRRAGGTHDVRPT